MILVNTDFVSGKEIETISAVKGAMIQSKHLGKDIAAGFKTLVGGELTGYSEMLNEARAMATKRMVEEAESLGADAVVNIRYTSAAVMQGAAEILVYGTAVRFVTT
ncbi:MAG: heavy metal-binding domain-containing protein [Spirochaetales bacterium]|nr:MAG: heavy metal-binding domain-containing protein [Spirochaetales bacterium]